MAWWSERAIGEEVEVTLRDGIDAEEVFWVGDSFTVAVEQLDIEYRLQADVGKWQLLVGWSSNMERQGPVVGVSGGERFFAGRSSPMV